MNSFRLAIPLIIAQIGQMTMGIVDTYVVGQYHYLELAGVAAGNGIFWPIVVICFGFTLGLETCVSHSHGNNNWQERDSYLCSALILAFMLTVAGMIIMFLIISAYPNLGTHPDVVDKTIPYLKVVVWSFPSLIFFNVIQRYWQAQGITILITLFMIVANILNYYLSTILVNGDGLIPPLGAVGAGYATVIMRCLLLLAIIMLTAVICYRRSQKITIFNNSSQLIASLRKLLTIGIPAGGQIVVELSVFALSTFFMSYFGSKLVSAHHIVLTLSSFAFMFPLGLASSTAIVVGHYFGKGQIHRAVRIGWLNIFSSTFIMGLFSTILVLFPLTFFSFFTHEEDILNASMSIIFIVSAFQVFDGVQVVATGALRGIGNTKMALISNLISHYIIGLPISMILCFTFEMNLSGVWIGLAAGLILNSFLITFYWHRLSTQSLSQKYVIKKDDPPYPPVKATSSQ